ncbi:MAG: carbamoyltransferase HypF [Saprospiraceae bacterium]
MQLTGKVQGVGFRPFVYQLAQYFELTGCVHNSGDGVNIEFNADELTAQLFYEQILSKAPPLSFIISHSLIKKTFIPHEGFKIHPSQNGDCSVLVPPDFAICEECRKEIGNPENRRYRYAFTTCTQCGPRYSIISKPPYDREHTSMAAFEMCPSCLEEYNDPLTRRHYSQTNSCPHCPVMMKLFDTRKNLIESNQEQIIHKICQLWNEGKIVAIKGIGGYLFTCDASNATTIQQLRKRKHRPSKPFALMFRDVQDLKNVANVTDAELAELQSVASPIVLVRVMPGSKLPVEDIAPGLSYVGAMLPYTPLYDLLLETYDKPIVATSGNLSGAPIVFEDEMALNELNSVADFILVNTQEISAPQDDSVVVFSRYAQQRMILRRARGFAPFYFLQGISLTDTTILATGALLKNTFTLLHHRNLHISQYLGDTTNYNVQKNYEAVLQHFLGLINMHPEIVLVDKHPDYYTTQLGKLLATQWSSQLISVQHHEAHFASVLTEHRLLDEAEPILGVVWDGTGYGNDGHIWGGEFFVFDQRHISRLNHFEYFNHMLGDKMASEPRISAFSLCYKMEDAIGLLKSKFSAEEWNNYLHLIQYNKLKTSSAGRLFDAVASMLGLIDKSSYEGQAALLL